MLGTIKLDERFSLEATTLCWVLKSEFNTGKKNLKSGKEIVSTKQTFHPTIQDALKKYVGICLEPSESAKDILKSIKELHAKIDAITLKRDYPNQKN